MTIAASSGLVMLGGLLPEPFCAKTSRVLFPKESLLSSSHGSITRSRGWKKESLRKHFHGETHRVTK